MRKIIGLFLLVIVLFMGTSLVMALKNVSTSTNDPSKNYVTSRPTIKSDDMLLEEGQYMITCNRSLLSSYLTIDSQSKKVIENYHKEASSFLKSEHLNDGVGDIYITLVLVSDLNYQMTLNGVFSMVGDKVESVKFTWYDGELIFNNNHGNLIYGEKTIRAYKGTTLTVKDLLMYFDTSNSEKELYLDINKVLEKDRTEKERHQDLVLLGNYLFDDLFVMSYSQPVNPDTPTVMKTLNFDSINAYLNDTLSYEISNISVSEAFERLYNVSYEDEGAKDIYEALVFEYSYRNISSLNMLQFYILVDVHKKYAGAYVRNGLDSIPECVYFVDKTNNVTFTSDNISFDLTGYESYSDLDCFENTYLVRYLYWDIDNKRYLFRDKTDLIWMADWPSNDLPGDFRMFV